MIQKCKYCKKEIDVKSKNTMVSHYAICVSFEKWRNKKFNYNFLYEEYVVKGKSALQIANENGWSSSSIINKQLRRLNIPVRSIKESHSMGRYKSKIEKTNLKKYGAKNPLSKGTSSYYKRNKTVKEKYGVDNVFQHPKIKEKIRNSGAFKTLFPNYNENAIPIIEQYGKDNGYTFQHAENGGEFFIDGLGYYVDGYDKENNVVIEVDESHHFDKFGNLKQKDVIRQKKIENLLGCKFIRIKYEN